MTKLVLLRHGESEWNKENRFTGWTDVDLSEQGIIEARGAGKILQEKGFVFDMAFTSYLKRAIKTLYFALDEIDQLWIPVEKSWRLNERHYGALQGLNKKDTEKKHSEAKVLLWRRSYLVRPPAIDSNDERFPGKDIRYAKLNRDEIPLTESLKDTVDRILPFWRNRIVPVLKKSNQVLIVAHGNSLRALVKYLDDIPDEDIIKLNIPTGIPLVYELNQVLEPKRNYYLADSRELKKAMDLVRTRSKAI